MIRTQRAGLSLAEVVISTLLVGVLMIAALTSVGSAVQTTGQSVTAGQGIILARELLDEVLALHYEDPNQTPVFGWEPGEARGRRMRGHADDLDDLDGWFEGHVEDRDGTAVEHLAGWSRSIEISKLRSTAPNVPPTALPDSAEDTGLRRVTVTVTGPDNASISLSALRCKQGGGLQPQGVSQDLVTWVGISLTPETGAPVSAGTALWNHASGPSP